MNLAQRDASWYRSPSTTNGGKFHVPNDGVGSLCGIAILDEKTRTPLKDVPVVLRCRRRACRKAMQTAKENNQ